MPLADLTTEELTRLLREAEKAHGQYEKELGERHADWAQADNVGEGLLVGFLAWLGFVATTKAVSSLYEGRSRNLYLIDVGYHLVELLVMGVILALWD